MSAMARCPDCAAEVPGGARYCPGCGRVQSSVSQLATAVAAPTPSGGWAFRTSLGGRPVFAFAIDD
jgi:hypothetical protein